MEKNVTDPPGGKTSVNAAGFVICLMSLFTLVWAALAFISLSNNPYSYALLLFLVLCIVMIRRALLLFKAAKLVPKDSVEGGAEQKKRDKRFNYILIAEGVGIFLAVNIVNNIGHPELDVPAIALIVGLHFFPLAPLLKRNVLYVVAVWSTLVAVIAFLLSLNNLLPPYVIIAFTATGMAFATSGYGLYIAMSTRIHIGDRG